MAGKHREPALVVILCGVTFNVYWFYWLRMAFEELAEDRNIDLRTFHWLAVLVPIWSASIVIGIVVGVQRVLKMFRAAVAGRPDPLAGFVPEYSPLFLTSVGLLAVFLGLQLVFLARLTDATEDAARAVNGPKPPSFMLAVGATVLLLAAQAPYVGAFFGVGAIACEIVWVIQMQQALNGYWARRPRGVAPPPATMPVARAVQIR